MSTSKDYHQAFTNREFVCWENVYSFWKINDIIFIFMLINTVSLLLWTPDLWVNGNKIVWGIFSFHRVTWIIHYFSFLDCCLAVWYKLLKQATKMTREFETVPLCPSFSKRRSVIENVKINSSVISWRHLALKRSKLWHFSDRSWRYQFLFFFFKCLSITKTSSSSYVKNLSL